MIRIDILVVGKLRERFLHEGTEEYLRRLRPYAHVEVKTVAEAKVSPEPAPEEVKQAQKIESSRLQKQLKKETFSVALHPQGKLYTSEELARMIANTALSCKSHLSLLVGGSLGLSTEIINAADRVVSFSPLTFPHQLFRLMLLEQLYRGFKINRGEPYHK